MQEQKVTLERFKKAFDGKKKKRIVLYGTGINAEAIVKNVTEYNIIGLMDAAKTGSIVWSLPVFSYEEVLENQADFIVIVARPAVYTIIYNRIAEFVEKNHIPVYDIDGNDIKELCRSVEKENEYFEVSKESLMQKVLNADAVSFDIFDTLLMRKVLYPTDVFELMEKKCQGKYSFAFAKERIGAEKCLLGKGINPTIRQIYECLAEKHNLTDDEVETLICLEGEMERNILVPRCEVVSVFNECKKSGKEIYLVSDMYFTKEILGSILHDFGIKDYSKLIISCEYGVSKKNGLFTVLKNELHGKECLHIGDNYEADVESAKKQGIETFKIMSAREMLECSLHDILLVDIGNLEKRIVIGMYAAKAFNNPFVLYHSKGKLIAEEKFPVAYLFVAPILLGFVFWLVKEAEKKELDTLWLGARDGYLIQKLYHMCCECLGTLECPNYYILISRRNVSMCAIENDSDILDMADSYQGKVKKALSDLFGICAKEADVEFSDEDLLRYAEEIKVQAKTEKCMYLEYLDKYTLPKYKRIGFFDFMSKGTCHLKLEKILDRKLFGLYFQKSQSKDRERNELEFSGFCDAHGAFEKNYAVFKYCDFLEAIVTDFNPSFYGYDSKGSQVFFPEKRSAEHLNWVRKMHEETVEYANDFLKIYPYQTDVDFAFYDRILGMMGNQYTVLEDGYQELKMYDGYSDKQINIGELFKP